MRPTDHLKSLCAEDWQAATRHAFTDRLAAGTLPEDHMLGYLEQDHLFLEGFVRLLASAVARAPSLPEAVPGAQFLGLICGEENTYFLRAIEALGGDATRPAVAHPVTAELQAIMHDAARSDSYARMLAVLVVAEWSYLDWAAPHAGKAESLPFWFGEWIALHSGAGFEGVVAHLRDQLDRVWPDLSTEEKREVEAAFIETTRLERAFFDAALAGYPAT